MYFPKVLVISHNCFSDFGSNGRTLANFFCGYPKDRLAQFYIYNELPCNSTCNNYYRVTDKQALKSVIFPQDGELFTKIFKSQETISGVSATISKHKTPFVYLMREFAWRFGHWKSKKLNNWINFFSPDVILLQAGDAAFLFKFAESVSKKLSIPVIIYNSESYYFKNKNYLQRNLFSNFWYKFQHKYFRKQVAPVIKNAACSIYISDDLKILYDSEFNVRSTTIMTSSDVKNIANASRCNNNISYMGNLTLGRDSTLIELANIINEIDSTYVIDVYGKGTEESIAKLKNARGIKYHGFVSYQECVRIMEESILLVHVEGFQHHYLEDSKYAFSTKIADSLSCGTCLFVLAPEELLFTKYLKDNKGACVVHNIDDAKFEILRLLTDEVYRQNYVNHALILAEKNHSMNDNRYKFWKVIGVKQNEDSASQLRL